MEEGNHNLIFQPTNLSKNLFPHQCCAIQMMEERERLQSLHSDHFCIQTNIGIYADITGYGKTISIVALILRDQMPWNKEEPFVVSNILDIYGNGGIIKRSLYRLQKIPTTLIVAGPSILSQWSQEIAYSSLTFTIINNRKKLISLEPATLDVVICPPKMYNLLMERFPNFAWKRFVYDEPHHGKIPAMKQIIAGYIWFVTATPHQLLYQNHSQHNFLQSIFSNCMDYHVFQKIIVKNPDEFVRQSFQLPPMHHKYHDCYQPVFNVVHNIISDHISSLIDAGNIEKATRLLGGCVGGNIFTVIENEKKESIREAIYKIEKFERSHDEHRVTKWKMRKQQLENEMHELQRRYTNFIMNTSCQICLSVYEKPVMLSCCQTTYCGGCIFQWLTKKTTCPHCRSLVTTPMMIYLAHTDSLTHQVQSLPTKKTKPQVILEIIDSKPQGKFIIFSNFDETFSVIRNALEEDGICFAEIAGTVESRQKKMDDFKTGSTQVLFLNSVANGAGINLPEATDIILYHRMSEDMEIQLIGRAYRIGRTLPLDVHHLL